MMKKIKEVLFISILGGVAILLLLGIASYTEPKILRDQELQLKSNVLNAAGMSYTPANMEEVFNKDIQTRELEDMVYYLTPDNLYIFKFSGNGLWGPIRGVVALNTDLKTIENISILYQEETPGLGGRITEKSFLRKFKNKKVAPALSLTSRAQTARDNQVDAITGATLTSNALIKIINKSVQNFRRLVRE